MDMPLSSWGQGQEAGSGLGQGFSSLRSTRVTRADFMFPEEKWPRDGHSISGATCILSTDVAWWAGFSGAAGR